jgi:hypothetical protein
MSEQTETSIAIIISHPPLPEGWQGTPQQLIEWMDEHALFESSGQFMTGQISESPSAPPPTTNVGLYVTGQEIMIWSEEDQKYVPLLTMPIGTILDWPALALNPPDKYEFCEGQTFSTDPLVDPDHHDLYLAIGRSYCILNPPDADNIFRLPDFRGRVAVGASDQPGYHDPLNPTPNPGRLVARSVGSYFGNDGPTYGINAPLNAQTPRYSVTLQGTSSSKPPFVWNKSTFNGIQPPSVGVRKIIRYK